MSIIRTFWSGIEISPMMMPLSREIYTFPNLPRGSFHGLPRQEHTPDGLTA